jgi:transposase
MPAISLRDDFDAATVRALASSRDVRQTRRLLALAAVYDGMSREEAAKRSAAWTARPCATGRIASTPKGRKGLTNRAAPGRQRRLTGAQMEALAEIVETGPDPKVDGV